MHLSPTLNSKQIIQIFTLYMFPHKETKTSKLQRRTKIKGVETDYIIFIRLLASVTAYGICLYNDSLAMKKL